MSAAPARKPVLPAHKSSTSAPAAFPEASPPPSIIRTVLLSVLFTVFITAVGVLLDAVLLTEHDSPRHVIQASDAFTGVLGGVLFLLILLSMRKRRARLAERLEAIRGLNDEIRNSLQIISLSLHSLPSAQRALGDIDNAVHRIEHALRDATTKI